MRGDLAGIARARTLGRSTMRNIRQNFVLAIIYNVIGIPIAAGVLYPSLGPVIAAAAMSPSSILVIGKALRLRWVALRQVMLTDDKISRIVHSTCPSLIGSVPGCMVRAMFARFLGRRVAALVVALGVILSGATPALAMPATGNMGSMPGMSMMMPDMAMQSDCAGMMAMAGKGAPAKQAPCKSTDGSCAVCAGCAVNIGLAPEIAPAALLYHRDSGAFADNVNPDGIASPPALPPPISRA